MLMKYLILFDIDGTILYLRKRISRVLFSGLIKKMLGREVPFEAMPDFAGMTDLQILKEIADNSGMDFKILSSSISDVWNSLASDFAPYCTKEYVALLPGIEELLKKLNVREDVLLGLLTGNFRQHAYLKLKTYGLDMFFGTGAFGSDHEDRNMLPPIAMQRANRLMEKKIFYENNTLIIGDTPRDIECAKTNNLPVLAVATGTFSYKKLEKCEPDVLMNDFSDVEKTIDTIFEMIKQ